nr:MAG TPA: hypothetical protein [Caudoviricetes sp.]
MCLLFTPMLAAKKRQYLQNAIRPARFFLRASAVKVAVLSTWIFP